MPSTTRRTFLLGSGTALVAASGCTAPGLSTTPAHWVTVYLGDRSETHDVSVTVTNENGTTVFEKDYELSDANEADEDEPFPASSDPETVVVVVDGARFERNWPGIEEPELPCESPNYAGIEIWVENDQNGDPDVRFDADCQTITSSRRTR